MNYRVDILTDAGLYIAEIPETSEEPWKLINQVRLKIKNLEDLKGWTPFENPDHDLPSTFTIEDGIKLKSFRIYDVTKTNLEGAEPTADKPIPKTPYPFTYFGEYLGIKLRITGVAFKTEVSEYLLPILVNDRQATDYMKPSELSQQIQLYKESRGIPPTEYQVIIPDVWLDYKTASEYITDYAAEVDPTTDIKGGGKAKAWSGWNKKQ